MLVQYKGQSKQKENTMRIAFTVEEVCKTTYTRYKYYRWPDGLALPEDWDKWSVDEKYTWVNNNCHFHSDYAEETDSEVMEEVATELEITDMDGRIVKTETDTVK